MRGEPLTTEEFKRRLLRSRQWHLREAGRQRGLAVEAVSVAVRQTELHDAAVREIDVELARLGPRPPFRPEVA